MNIKTRQILEQHAKDLEKINNQRRLWLYASSVVLTGIIFLIFTWDWLDHFHSHTLWWAIVSTMMIICVNWWYWTMRVIRILLNHQEAEYDLLSSVLNDISKAREEIKFLVPKNLDTNQ
jgi:uncharacterized membrane protein